jgi:hypothetical protein
VASTGTAHAEAPTDAADIRDPESSGAPALGEDGDPIPHLRFADRRQVLFRVGFGGTYQDAFFDNPKAQPSLGAILRWERPVHEYVTTGLGFSFYGTKPKFLSRQPAFDASLFVKGRYPFEMGKKERRFESEVYLLADIGLLIWLDTNALDLNLIGPGFSVSVTPGYLFFINQRVGLLAELGWSFSEAFFARGRSSILLHQGLARVGVVFPC